MSVIQADSDEKSRYPYDESESRKSKIVEKLVRDMLIVRLYIEDTCYIYCYFRNSYSPKYRSVNSVDENQKEKIDERKVEHSSSIGKT